MMDDRLWKKNKNNPATEGWERRGDGCWMGEGEGSRQSVADMFGKQIHRVGRYIV